MWAVSDIVLELQSSGKLLAGKDQGDPFAAALVQGLCAKIKGLEGFNAMHAVEIKTAAETALPMVFQTSVGKAIEESLLATPTCEKPSIAKPQTLVELQNYLTHNDWLVLEDINSSLIQKQNTLALRLRHLGVVSLHEQTCKAAVSLILHTVSSLPDYDVIHSMVMDFKGAFAASGGACKSGIYINKYPVNPSDLPPQLFKDAYGSEVPQPKVLEKLQVLKQHIPLRQTSKLLGKSKVVGSNAAVQAQPAQPALAGMDPAPLQQSMMQFGLLPMFQQVMHMQKQVLDMQQGQHTTTHPMEVDATASSTAVQKALTLKPTQKQTLDGDNKFRLPLADAAHDEKQAHDLGGDQKTPENNTEVKNANAESKPAEEYEKAAYQAIMDRKKAKVTPKAKQAAGKAKAKAASKAKAKAKAVMKRPSSKSIGSMAGTSSACMAYQPAPPTEVELKSTKNAYTDKHYHKCRDLAKARGYEDDDAKRSARKARAIAVELWQKAIC
eukprot:symbB.v1.2.027902.t1/scaffold2899.1/size67670/2